MSDVVVTVPKPLWLDWIAEGDSEAAIGEERRSTAEAEVAGQASAKREGGPWSGQEWGFFLGGPKPAIARGERVYIVSHGRLRGYSPLTRLTDERTRAGQAKSHRFALCREGGAVAVTIPDRIPGFRGWRKRWWDRAAEVPFPDWRLCDVVGSTVAERGEIERERIKLARGGS